MTVILTDETLIIDLFSGGIASLTANTERLAKMRELLLAKIEEALKCMSARTRVGDEEWDWPRYWEALNKAIKTIDDQLASLEGHGYISIQREESCSPLWPRQYPTRLP